MLVIHVKTFEIQDVSCLLYCVCYTVCEQNTLTVYVNLKDYCNDLDQMFNKKNTS